MPTPQAPIFIGGVNRSGTSLTRQLIGSHSQVAMPPTEFGFFMRFKDPNYTYSNRSEFMKAVEDVLSWSKLQDWNLSESAIRTAAQDANLTVKNIFLLFLNEYRKQLGKSRLGEKTTHYELHFNTLESWFGTDFYFIQIVRNPIDTFASLRKYQGEEQQVNPRAWATAWVRSVHLGLQRNFTHRKQYRLIRYEDLICNTEPILQELCDFLQLIFEPKRMLSMKDFEQKENSSFTQETQDKTYQNSIRKSDNIDRRGLLSEQELDTITRNCASTAKMLGYDIGQQYDQHSQTMEALDKWPMKDLLIFMTRYIAKRTLYKIRPSF